MCGLTSWTCSKNLWIKAAWAKTKVNCDTCQKTRTLWESCCSLTMNCCVVQAVHSSCINTHTLHTVYTFTLIHKLHSNTLTIIILSSAFGPKPAYHIKPPSHISGNHLKCDIKPNDWHTNRISSKCLSIDFFPGSFHLFTLHQWSFISSSI